MVDPPASFVPLKKSDWKGLYRIKDVRTQQMDLPTGVREGFAASGDVWEKMIYDHCVAKKGFVDDDAYLSEEKLQCLDLNYIEILVYKVILTGNNQDRKRTERLIVR